MYFLYMNSEGYLTWPFLHNNANSKSRSGRFKNIVVPALITRVFRTSHPLNRGPDSLWSLKIPGCPSKKSRGITQASWTNFPIDLWPSWPSNHPHIYWLASSLGVLSTSKLECGGRSGAMAAVTSSRWILHIGGGRDYPLLCKALWVPRKALYKCNKL